MGYRYTKHQVPRGTKPDEETNSKIFLLKSCSELRLTYQIKLLTYLALQKKKKLIIEIPKNCRIHESLMDFRKQHSKTIKVIRN